MSEPGDRDVGFLGRWSRRKAQVREGTPIPVEPARPTPVSAPLPAPDAELRASASAVEAPDTAASDAALPTIEDARALTSESDFRPFAARGVAPDVRNTAMRKLFADPHFNVMDRMDVYIDDYSKPDPIPPAMLRQLVSARFLDLFDEEKNKGRKDPAPGDGGVDADAAAPGGVAQLPQCNELPSQLEAPAQPASQPHDAHADLRLQPDDAAPGKDPGRGAG